MKRTRRKPTDPAADPRKAKKMQTGVSLHTWHVARADALAESMGLTRSDLIAAAIDSLWSQRASVAAMLDSPAIRTAMLEAFSHPDTMRALIQAHSPDAPPLDDDQLKLFASQALTSIAAKDQPR